MLATTSLVGNFQPSSQTWVRATRSRLVVSDPLQERPDQLVLPRLIRHDHGKAHPAPLVRRTASAAALSGSAGLD
jgi:hypothetical protein